MHTPRPGSFGTYAETIPGGLPESVKLQIPWCIRDAFASLERGNLSCPIINGKGRSVKKQLTEPKEKEVSEEISQELTAVPEDLKKEGKYVDLQNLSLLQEHQGQKSRKHEW